MAPKMSRREFLRKSLLAAATAGAVVPSLAAEENTPTRPTNLPTRVLGRTGEAVSIFGLGGQGILEIPGHYAEAEALINRAADLGVTYFDSARIYGPSEEYYGLVLPFRRQSMFITSKVDVRTYDEARRSIETTLTNMRVDGVDLLQVHRVRDLEDVDRITGPDGSLKAMIEAREQGMCKYLGITGHHDPAALIEMIRRFDFDTVLCPLNAADIHFLPFQTELLKTALLRRMGVIAMKIPALNRLFSPQITSIVPLLRYSLSLPVTTAVVGCMTISQLEENVAVARDFTPMTEQEKRDLEELTKPLALEGTFFKKGSAGWND